MRTERAECVEVGLATRKSRTGERISAGDERTCVENNAGHGEISIVGVAP